MELSTTVLTTIRIVAERRSFTAAAEALGYTQSAVSRQVALAERELGTTLFDRVRGGVRLTGSGAAVLRQVVLALDALEQARREADPAAVRARRVRLGAFATAGHVLVPRAVAVLARTSHDLEVHTREAASPALVRSVRSGSLDFAVVTSRPPYRAPDRERPALVTHALFDSTLAVAVPTTSAYARTAAIDVDTAAAARWIGTASGGAEPQLGVWPGLPGRPRIWHAAKDWTTKLALVASGAGITTIPSELFAQLPPEITVTGIAGVPEERRRVSLVHRPDRDPGLVEEVLAAFTAACAELRAARGRR